MRSSQCCAWALAAAGLAGCAAVNPNLLPARILREGQTVVNVGGAYAAPVADTTLREADEARARLAQSTAIMGDDERFRRVAAAWGNNSAGLASYLAVHHAFGNDIDAHVALIGPRIVRVGVRRGLWRDATGRATLVSAFAVRGGYQPLRIDAPAGGLVVGDSGLVGADASLALGRTVNEIYDVWLSLRGGYLFGTGGVRDSAALGGGAWGATLHRVEAGLGLGLRVGFGRVSATIELEAAFAWYSAVGNNGTSAQGALLALTPGAAFGLWF